MNTTECVFKLRWLYWAIGLFAIVTLQLPAFAASRERLQRSIEKRFYLWLGSICGFFFIVALAAKVSQLWTLRLNGMDFWLFEDMTTQLLRGGAMLTRFAPQSVGFVQHGAVHAMLSWFLTAPLAFLLSFVGGSLAASLVYNPLVLSLAAFFLGLIIRNQLSNQNKNGSVFAVSIAAAFLISTQVGHVLMYDVHPESAYPLAVFLWIWSFQKRKLWALLGATLFGMGIKEDSFLVFFPLILWMAWTASEAQRRKLAVFSFITACLIFLFQMKATGAWASGTWGPIQWDGHKVHIPIGPDLIKGVRWTSPSDARKVIHLLLTQDGGISGFLLRAVKFLFSRPWLSLVIFAPWVLPQKKFWFVLGALALAYSQLGRAAILNLYYSAPFLGAFWWIASENLSSRMTLWLVLSPILLGDGSPVIYFPSSQVFELKHAVESQWKCVEDRLHSETSQGVVAANLLAWIPRNRVFSQRFPEIGSQQWDHVSYVMINTQLPTYEIPKATLDDWIVRAHSLGYVEQCSSEQTGDVKLKTWIKSH